MRALKAAREYSDNHRNISINLKNSMQRLGVTIGDLAVTSGLDVSRLAAMIECTAENITVLEIERVASTFEKPATWLLTSH